jgi:hypothetical protein
VRVEAWFAIAVMRGVIGRQVDREPGLDGRSDQVPVLVSDGVVAQREFVGEGDDVLAGVGGNELCEQRTVDLCIVSRQVAGLRVAPQTARPERRDFCAELRPGAAGETAGYAISVVRSIPSKRASTPTGVGPRNMSIVRIVNWVARTP